jgi:hypothetical protein
MGSHAIARACFERQVGGARVKQLDPSLSAEIAEH